MAAADGKVISERKTAFFAKLLKLLGEYPKIVIVNADNVGSNHLQRIRKALAVQKAVMLMGKNTLVRKAIRGNLNKNPQLEVVLAHLRGNVGLIFTKGDLTELKKIIDLNKVPAPARAGALSPCEVIIPALHTQMEPTKTSFFQALNINTKITKGTIEITQDVHLLKVGQKVGTSEATLLQVLDIRPFLYGLKVTTVYDNGQIFDASLLDMSPDVLIAKFKEGVANIAAISLATGIPTKASLPHSLARGFRNVLSVGLGTQYTFAQLDKLKSAGPAASAPAAAPAAAAKGADKKEDKKPAKKEEPEEEADLGMSLFD